MTLKGYRSRSQSFNSKYLESGDRCKVGHRGGLFESSHGLCIGTDKTWTSDDFAGSKIKVILFDIKYVKNGNSYDVGPNRDYRVAHRLHMPLPSPYLSTASKHTLKNITVTRVHVQYVMKSATASCSSQNNQNNVRIWHICTYYSTSIKAQ